MSPQSSVERSVMNTLPPKDSTPSSRVSISASAERYQRIHGASLIRSASVLLNINPSTTCTSCVIFHRFFHRRSLSEFDVWSVAMASTLLGGKVEEDTSPIRNIIIVFAHLYRRRRLRMGHCSSAQNVSDDETGRGYTVDVIAESPLARLETHEKENVLRHIPPMSQFGQAYQEWREALVTTENVILRELGFTLYWIPDSHPHKFILYFARVIEVENDVARRAWNYCNDSCFLDLCVRFEPELIVCASLIMASCDEEVPLPMQPRPWWEVFVGEGRGEDLATICNAILSLSDEEVSGLAFRIFVTSLIPEGSFNDPGSFLWHLADLKETK